jgi:hypothetical protein
VLGNPALAAANKAEAAERAEQLRPVLAELNDGRSLRTIAAELDARGITTPIGSNWTAAGVQRVLKRLALPAA